MFLLSMKTSIFFSLIGLIFLKNFSSLIFFLIFLIMLFNVFNIRSLFVIFLFLVYINSYNYEKIDILNVANTNLFNNFLLMHTPLLYISLASAIINIINIILPGVYFFYKSNSYLKNNFYITTVLLSVSIFIGSC